jgi:hypothetical protein
MLMAIKPRGAARADLRAPSGMQPFAGEASVDLIYVADLSRMTEASPEEKRWYSGPDAGFVAQTVGYPACGRCSLAPSS